MKRNTVNKRHAKPAALTLAERSYRRLLRMDDALQAISPAVVALEGHVRTLTDHCARLLREKETLQKRLYAVQELKDEADWRTPMERVVDHMACPYYLQHELNKSCQHCGFTARMLTGGT
jgi:hypothetical protein